MDQSIVLANHSKLEDGVATEARKSWQPCELDSKLADGSSDGLESWQLS
jgi:hypothetical protein